MTNGVQFLLTNPGGEFYEEAPNIAGIPNPFDLTDINEGDIIEGNLAYMVPTSTQDLTVAFTWPNMSGVSLALR